MVARPGEEAVLVVDEISVNYGKVPALFPISLKLSKGEVLAVVGPNGAGKTTLLNAIMGAVPLKSGSIYLNGASITKKQTFTISRRGVSLVPEGRQIFPNLTVAQNLRVAGSGIPGGGSRSFQLALDLFPALGSMLTRPAGVLSGGQQQQLAIARAMIRDPQVLMLDEPTLGLAAGVIDTVFEALDVLRSQGRAVLLVEQRARRAVAFADRSIVLANGAVRGHFSPTDAQDEESFMHAYFGDTAS